VKGLGRVADGVAECQKAVREELRSGADFIKIMCSGGVASPTDKLESTQYTAKEIRAMTTIAANMGTYVTAHAYTPIAIQQAIANGVRGIEHGNLLDKETAEEMAKRGCFLTPTLVTYATMASDEFPGFLTPENTAKNQEVLKVGLQSIKLAYEAGVTMCFGSDLLGPMGYTQTREFGLRRQVLDAKTVLQCATVNAAKLLRQEEFLGQIKQGFAADLLILNKNPLEDVEVLDRPTEFLLAVVKDGRVYSSRWSKLPVDARPPVQLIE
jgi:imidazolonepropionase-like amidohydrolase